MDYLREIGITVVDRTIRILKWFEYTFYLCFSSHVQAAMEKQMLKWDVKINGKNPWDIQVHNKTFYARVAAYGTLGLGESFMEGWWDCEQVDVMLTKMLRGGAFAFFYTPYNNFLHDMRWNFFNMQTRKKATEVRDQHYDLGKDIYEIFLDPTLNYSCAYWKTATNETDAQRDKMELIAQKLKLEPGMKVLDIGMGYGGIEKYLAENYAVSVHGVTISKEMAKEAARVCAGLNVTIQNTDWRDITGKYDRIICIEMIEHVGGQNYREFMELVNRCLVDDGIFVLQTNGINDCKYPLNDAFFNTVLFNGMYMPRLEELVDAANSLFIVEDLQNLGSDYDLSLMAGLRNFDNNWANSDLSKKYSPAFYRMWRYYLLFSAAVTRSRICQLWQIVYTKNGLIGGYRAPR